MFLYKAWFSGHHEDCCKVYVVEAETIELAMNLFIKYMGTAPLGIELLTIRPLIQKKKT